MIRHAEAAPINTEHENIIISVDDEMSRITISTKNNSEINAEYFDLDSPRRLIVDLRGETIRKNHLRKIKSSLFSAIRFGAHTDRARIVFDSNKLGLASYTISQYSNHLLIELNPAKPATLMATPQAVKLEKENDATENPSNKNEELVPSTTSTPMQEKSEATNTPTPTIESTKTAKPTPEAATPTSTASATAESVVTATASTSTPDVTNTAPSHEASVTTTPAPLHDTATPETQAPQPSPVSTIVVTPTIEAANAATMVTGIMFEREGQMQSPIIRVSMNRRSEYRMSRLDEKFYKISIPNVHLAKPTFGLPQFPPQDFEGFALVSATDEARGIEIKVGVERNSKINVVTAENDILIRIAK